MLKPKEKTVFFPLELLGGGGDVVPLEQFITAVLQTGARTIILRGIWVLFPWPLPVC